MTTCNALEVSQWFKDTDFIPKVQETLQNKVRMAPKRSKNN